MEKQKRYNGSMERVGESLTAEAAAVTYSFCFHSLASTQRMKLRALGISRKERGQYESMGEEFLFIGGMGEYQSRFLNVKRLYMRALRRASEDSAP